MKTRSHHVKQRMRISTTVAVIVFSTACSAIVDDSPPINSTDGKGLLADILDGDELVVATGDYKVPTNFKNDKGELAGLNIDLSKALGKELGVELKLVPAPFDAVLAGIQAGRFDTALFNISDNAERREVVDFVDYAMSGSAIVTRPGERLGMTTGPESLCGHSVAVTGGQHEFQVLTEKVQPLCVERSEPPIQLQTYPNEDALHNAVRSGRADAFVGGLTTTPYMVAQNRDTFELVGKMELDDAPLGMPFAKGRPEVVKAVLQAWRNIWTSGEYQKIAAKWSLSDIVPKDVAEFVINSGEGLPGGDGS